MDEKYDVIIIGAGVGGLVSGCYLAKAGLKVLIVEQHYKPGGYCTSFERKGYKFDVGVHYLGSMREGGILFKVLKELELLEKLKIITNDPTDIIITPQEKVLIRKNPEDTLKELACYFPKEKENLERFFNFILSNDFLFIISKTQKFNFKKFLTMFFKNYKLQVILSTLIGNLGLPPSEASALVAVTLYKEYILDGGYYPCGGIQMFSDLLSLRFKEYGGRITLRKKATKIITKNRKAIGIELEDGEKISGEYIISNADATLTFTHLLDCESEEREKVKKMQITPSAFMIYLGINKKLNITPHYTSWYFFHYDIDRCYKKETFFPNKDFDYLVCGFPSSVDLNLAPSGKEVVKIGVGMSDFSLNRDIWEEKKELFSEILIEKVASILEDFKNSIEVKEIATPYTFFSYTFNQKGAMFGWAAIPRQVNRSVFPPLTSIENLLLTGHWVTNGIGQSGIPVVALSGRNVAHIVLRKSSRVKS